MSIWDDLTHNVGDRLSDMDAIHHNLHVPVNVHNSSKGGSYVVLGEANHGGGGGGTLISDF